MLIEPYLKQPASLEALFSLPEHIRGMISVSAQPIEKTEDKRNALQQAQLELPESLKHAILKRQVEFLTGRNCARTVLQNLGVDFRGTLGIGSSREPLWPEGIIGSITHNAHWALAVAAQHRNLRILGIDLETLIDQKTVSDVETLVCTPFEQQQLIDAGLSRQQATTLLFSAKESLFKALYPSVQSYFDFSCARLTRVYNTEHRINLALTKTLCETCQNSRILNCYYALDDSQVITLCVE
ncbi:MAG: Enterobactin synthase component D [Candidatus Celerinatantimonas neptuna]|nr:MAG: Enterobactin synthase component D [Candidatus Celerinatantimonas neptuna]